MLDKLDIHIKNVIFFKAVVYSLLSILLFSLIPIFKQDLVQSNLREKKAQNFLIQAVHKLDSIVDFEATISDTNNRYKRLVDESANQGCVDHTNLNIGLSSLENKYGLSKHIEVTVARLFGSEATPNKNNKITINNYEAIIKYASQDKRTALELSEALYALLPQGAAIVSFTTRKLGALSPSSIKELSTQKSPDLFETVLKVHLQEIAYEK